MKRIPCVVLCLFAFACGGSSGPSTPTTPSVTAPTITTTNTSVYVGQSVTFSATGGGTIRWGGDSPSVAAVDQTTGRVTGADTGRVTIWAENAGGRTTRLLKVIPSFAGSWVGNWIVDGCQQNGGFTLLNVCSGPTHGLRPRLKPSFSQTETNVGSGPGA